MPPVEAGEAFNLSTVWPGDYIASLEMRALSGPNPGRTKAWITTPLPIVAGEPTTDLARFALLVDTANGIAVRRPPEEWQFPNVDLTIRFFRQPEGAWVGFDTSVTFGSAGHGLTSTELYDERGHVGRAAQTLLVRPRWRRSSAAVMPKQRRVERQPGPERDDDERRARLEFRAGEDAVEDEENRGGGAISEIA